MGKGKKRKLSKKQSEHARLSIVGVSVSSPADVGSQHHPYPQPFPKHLPVPNNTFLRNKGKFQKSFQASLDTAYEGFVVDAPNELFAAENKHSAVEHGLETMHRAGFFRTDVTQPFGLGTKCARTYVTRCLLGDEGTTYKYLGLRMFAHPWDKDVDRSTDSDDLEAAVKIMHGLNERLTERTKTHLGALNQGRKARGAQPTKGRAGFDITLINRMAHTTDLKDEPTMSEGKCSVSWHADSSLEHFSTIAVYQVLTSEEATDSNTKINEKGSWSVALRVAHNSEGPLASRRGTDIESAIVAETPPVAVSLPSRSTYYLLDDFNHHHQHAVLSEGTPSCIRYSSTHRLLRESHNVKFLLERCRATCSGFHKKGPKVWRSEQLLLDDLESEWLRQFYIQGQAHYDCLWPAWGSFIKQCWKYWVQLEERTKLTIDLLSLGAEGTVRKNQQSNWGTPPPKAERKQRDKRRKAAVTLAELIERGNMDSPRQTLFDAFAEHLDDRANMRERWAKREQDHAFRELGSSSRPLPFPAQFGVGQPKSIMDGVAESPLPGSPSELRAAAARLRSCGKALETCDENDLPEPLQLPFAEVTSQAKVALEDWIGWSSRDRGFGLEMQDPWARHLLDGTKTIETRSYDLPAGLLGRRVEILQSERGRDGVSALGNHIHLGVDVQCVGWVVFDSVIKYTTRDSFERDENKHLVRRDSGYGWKDGKTKIVYGWVVKEMGRHSESSTRNGASATRRMRSLFELKDEPASKPKAKTKRRGKKKRY